MEDKSGIHYLYVDDDQYFRFRDYREFTREDIIIDIGCCRDMQRAVYRTESQKEIKESDALFYYYPITTFTIFFGTIIIFLISFPSIHFAKSGVAFTAVSISALVAVVGMVEGNRVFELVFHEVFFFPFREGFFRDASRVA